MAAVLGFPCRVGQLREQALAELDHVLQAYRQALVEMAAGSRRCRANLTLIKIIERDEKELVKDAARRQNRVVNYTRSAAAAAGLP